MQGTTGTKSKSRPAMSDHGAGAEAVSKTVFPLTGHRPRQRLTRSITELSSPIRLRRPRSHNRSRSRRRADEERDREERGPLPPSAKHLRLFPGRLSLDAARSEGVVTPSRTPDASRPTSILVANSDDLTLAPGTQMANMPSTAMVSNAPSSKLPSLSKEEETRIARQRARAREKYVHDKPTAA